MHALNVYVQFTIKLSDILRKDWHYFAQAYLRAVYIGICDR